MLREENFWIEEKLAPLLSLNNKFIEKGEKTSELFQRVSRWRSVANPNLKTHSKVKIVEPSRIIKCDAERTFKSEANREKLCSCLAYLGDCFGDYHQGLSYVTSFLLLTLPEEEVITILLYLNEDQKYVPGYWRAEAIAFATDAHVFESLLRERYSKVAEHLSTHCILPETFCQKWFIGLCVHVLSFDALFIFFRTILGKGIPFFDAVWIISR